MSYVLACIGDWIDLLLVAALVTADGPTILASSAVGDLLGALLLGALGAVWLLAVFELLRRCPVRGYRDSPRSDAFVLAMIATGFGSTVGVLCGLPGGSA
ncbi:MULTISPECIES: hypothetical protein [unclassified Crossiella]|uniref:hypothetical protein n=1 Tax=unclassified Crossiella TaxID=2620835 RepID=UPI001FFF3A5F|nr:MULTISPECIES: hypothetical protein [unclassified Crossiella]MCK2243711.1 hypothetical protein [Crossiella sp. S99.2]MCK2257570.1 hypothetical protein [Crossiella sp. S99.1]